MIFTDFKFKNTDYMCSEHSGLVETFPPLHFAAVFLQCDYFYAPTDFFVWNLILNNFYFKHFLIQRVFLVALSP